MNSASCKMPCALRWRFCHRILYVPRGIFGAKIGPHGPGGVPSREGAGDRARPAPQIAPSPHMRHGTVIRGPAFDKRKCKTPGCEVTQRRRLIASQPHRAAPGKAPEKQERSAWNTAQACGARQTSSPTSWQTNISATAGQWKCVPSCTAHRSTA